MTAEFGRVNRGIVWHVLAPSTGRESVLCGEVADLVDVVQAHALKRGRVCPRCADVVDQLAAAVQRAGGSQS